MIGQKYLHGPNNSVTSVKKYYYGHGKTTLSQFERSQVKQLHKYVASTTRPEHKIAFID